MDKEYQTNRPPVLPKESNPEGMESRECKEHEEYTRFKLQYGLHFNEQQDAAVKAIDGPVLLLAVPGSGKTSVLVARLGYMINSKHIPPGNILTVTYTVAATEDMRNRFISLFGEENAGELEFRTINGICQKILNYYGRITGKKPFEVADKQANDIIKTVFGNINHAYATEYDIKSITVAISYVKNMRLTEEQLMKFDPGIDHFTEIYRAYHAQLRQRSLMDYDDQMVYAMMILEKYPNILEYFQNTYRYICVDEAQDTSKIQHDILRILASRYHNLFMVGDEDQSIYGFRAAYPQGLLDFEKNYTDAKVLVMETNYRSNEEIVEKADAFICQNQYRHAKQMKAIRPTGGCVKKTELNARKNQYQYLLKVAQDCRMSTAVLYRNNECAIPLMDLLERNRIPFKIKKSDMMFFSYPVVTDMMDILHFAQHPTDGEVFLRIYYKIGTSLKKIYAQNMVDSSWNQKPILLLAWDFHEIPFYIKKTCREVSGHLDHIASTTPGRAVYHILHILGYAQYIAEHNMDMGKADILQILANSCGTIPEFLNRLSELRGMMENGTGDSKAKFILSTIHSSKGLEYDRVYLMDMIGGLLPSVAKPTGNAPEAEKILYEEERRLFYVAMTRAKNELFVFTFLNEDTSSFSKELFSSMHVKQGMPSENHIGQKASSNSQGSYTENPEDAYSAEETESRKTDFEIGIIVRHRLYGRGVIAERNGDKVEVSFDNGRNSTMSLEYVVRKGLLVAVE